MPPYEQPMIKLNSWNHTRARALAVIGMVCPALSTFLVTYSYYGLGGLLIVVGILSTFGMPLPLKQIIIEKETLDERETKWRYKAFETSYKRLLTLVVILFTLAMRGSDQWLLPNELMMGMFGILVLFYGLMLPLAYLAWNVSPPEAEIE